MVRRRLPISRCPRARCARGVSVCLSRRRNNEVDRWDKKAAGLPLPDVDPSDVSHIVTGGGHAPTPARKWILACQNILGFRRAHWMTRYPVCALAVCALAPVYRGLGRVLDVLVFVTKTMYYAVALHFCTELN